MSCDAVPAATITDETVNITDDIEPDNNPDDIEIVGDTDTSEIDNEKQNN